MTMKTFLTLIIASILVACAGSPRNQRQEPPVKAATQRPIRHHQTMELMPPISEFGQRTVEDVLRDFGPAAVLQLRPVFDRAGIAYPPREITLVALKKEKRLELWARNAAEFRFIRDYDIKGASGKSGPKLRQGDKQVPEGLYHIVGLNPNSNYHLSLKLDYPNHFDLLHATLEGRDDPGSDIFIHGKDVSVGCLAMGDEAIEELFVLTAQIGAENARVIIAPQDPRLSPLESATEGLPPWTHELYSMIADEIQALSDPTKVANYELFPYANTRLQRR